MRWALILLALASPADAACRLSTSECAVVAEELRIDAIENARTRIALRHSGLSPYAAGRKAIEIKYARLRARVKVLPTRIGDELARSVLCESAAAAGEINARCD